MPSQRASRMREVSIAQKPRLIGYAGCESGRRCESRFAIVFTSAGGETARMPPSRASSAPSASQAPSTAEPPSEIPSAPTVVAPSCFR